MIAVALAATAVGFAFDAGSADKELSHVFGAMYVLGCVAAVLAARQSAVFTAVVQPPLILFCTVPTAYWLFHGGAFDGLKGIAINCGYPLIERFPLMLFTSVTVLLIGLVRWYLGSAAAKSGDAAPTLPRWLTSAIETVGTKISAVLNRNPAHVVGKDGGAKTARSRRPAETRRRRPEDRPRRTPTGERRTAAERRAASERRTTRSAADSRRVRSQSGEEPRDEQLRRRPRPAQDPGRRGQPGQPPRARRDPHTRTARPTARDERRPERSAQPADSPRPRRTPAAGTSRNNGSGATHHPVSRVRYRESDSEAGQRDTDYRRERRRSPEPRDAGADDWRYDI